MKNLSLISIALGFLVVLGCKQKEPIPPTTPPPTESQVPAQSTTPRGDSLAVTAPVQETTPPDVAQTPPSSHDISSNPSGTDANVSPTSTASVDGKGNTAIAAAKDAPNAASGSPDGATVYQAYCQTCHGATGGGDGPAAAGLATKPASFVNRAFKLDPNKDSKPGELEDVIAVIRDGAAKYGGSPLMVPWPTLSAEQRDAVAHYVLSLGRG